MTTPFHRHLTAAFERAGGRPLAQVATVSAAGLPEVRTVVLRHLGEASDPFFASDARSAKFAALASHPWLELCLWQASVGIQLRLRGRAVAHSGDAVAVAMWNGLPRETRKLFFSPPPGQPLTGPASGSTTAPQLDPPSWFAVVRVPPQRFERLKLGPPLERRLWTDGVGGWTVQDVVP